MVPDNESASFATQVQQHVPDVTTSARWGRHQVLLNGRTFATYSPTHVFFKLDGDVLLKAFEIPGSEVWNPANKEHPSKHWVQVARNQRHYWLKLVLRAVTLIGREK